MTTIWRDERGNPSAARVLLVSALVYEALYLGVWGRDSDTLGVVVTFFTALDMALVTWAAGPRIAQYLGPQVAGAVQGVAASAKAMADRVAARRSADDGIEDSR